jgi:hypothetical protein
MLNIHNFPNLVFPLVSISIVFFCQRGLPMHATAHQGKGVQHWDGLLSGLCDQPYIAAPTSTSPINFSEICQEVWLTKMDKLCMIHKNHTIDQSMEC